MRCRGRRPARCNLAADLGVICSTGSWIVSERTVPWGLRSVIVAVATNAVCWFLFLVTEPRATELLAHEARGEIVLNSAAPILVAERAVETHGPIDGVFLYEGVSLPGVALGRYVGDELPFWFPTWSRHGVPVWRDPGSRSWALAGGLFVGTSLWWGVMGLFVGYLARKLRAGAGGGEARQITRG